MKTTKTIFLFFFFFEQSNIYFLSSEFWGFQCRLVVFLLHNLAFHFLGDGGEILYFLSKKLF